MKKVLFSIIGISLLLFLSCSNYKEQKLTTPEEDFTESQDKSIVYGIDRGNRYHIVKIGCQYWMKENLKDTGDIRHVQDKHKWDTMTTPAWCYYNNNDTNNKVYGKFYNWYAAQSGKLCPKGWHIPTDEDWAILEIALGMKVDDLCLLENNMRGNNENVGGKLKANNNLWNPNLGNDSSGFTALPGGFYDVNDGFKGIRTIGHFWSSTGCDPTFPELAIARHFESKGSFVFRHMDLKKDGFSCRCVKD